MKKLLILSLTFILILVLGSFVNAQNLMEKGNVKARMGIDVGGSVSVLGITENVNTGFSISGEYVVPYKNNLDLGAGITYQIPRKVPDGDNFNFIPFYGLVNYELEKKGYLIGHLGYNLFSIENQNSNENYNGGFYYGAGFGLKINNNLNAEALYSKNNGSVDDGTTSVNLSYSKFTLGLSYKF